MTFSFLIYLDSKVLNETKETSFRTSGIEYQNCYQVTISDLKTAINIYGKEDLPLRKKQKPHLADELKELIYELKL